MVWFPSDIIVAILRIIYLVALDTAKDYTWVAVNCWIWSVLEPSLAVIVACSPTFGPFVAAIRGRVQTKKSSSSSYPSKRSYPERRQQLSNMSDSEYPLHPIYGNHAEVNAKRHSPSAAGREPSPLGDLEKNAMGGEMGREMRSPHIKVQRDIEVRRSPG